VGDCLQLLDLTYEYCEDRPGGSGLHFYQLLHATGIFSDDAPITVRMLGAGRKGQLTPAQLIDRYDLACRSVRDLLVDYLSERQPALDYTSLNTLASNLGLLFWKDSRKHHPSISSLDLARMSLPLGSSVPGPNPPLPVWKPGRTGTSFRRERMPDRSTSLLP